MLFFVNDYAKGVYPKILEKIQANNLTAFSGYSTDEYCQSALQKLRQICNKPDADIHFLVGGTQTNMTVIKAMLAPYQGVISADTGHISTHEAGAIEATGHKVLTLPHDNGKLHASQIEQYLTDFYADANHQHGVFPAMVYISHPTEYGTLYSKDELINISKICKQYDIPLFLDGARLAYAVCTDNTPDLATIASLCDVFYFGGTKAGLLFGEAVIFSNPEFTPKHFYTIVKQQGALLAKGYLLGMQFDTLFSDDLYLKIGKTAVEFSQHIAKSLQEKGYQLLLHSPTNQQFVILSNEKLQALSNHVKLGFWQKHDENHTVVRIATDWATTQAEVEELLALF